MKDTIVCKNFILRKLKPIEDKESIVENINDKSILYTCSQAILDGIKEEKPASLFTITEE